MTDMTPDEVTLKVYRTRVARTAQNVRATLRDNNTGYQTVDGAVQYAVEHHPMHKQVPLALRTLQHTEHDPDTAEHTAGWKGRLFSSTDDVTWQKTVKEIARVAFYEDVYHETKELLDTDD